MDYKYTGIILSKNNVGETDRIYNIYTLESGKIRVLGKGVRKPNAKLAGSLESLTMSEIFVAKSRGMGKITGAITLENFSNIKSDIDALSKINYVLKIFNRVMVEQEQDKEAFEILIGFLQSMEKGSGKEDEGKIANILMLGFLFKLLSIMGYRLEMDSCVICGQKLRPHNNYFSPEKGGVVCEKCYQPEGKRLHPHTKRLNASNKGYMALTERAGNFGVGVKISPEAIKLIRIFLKNRIESLVKLQVAEKDINNLKIIAQEAVNWL